MLVSEAFCLQIVRRWTEVIFCDCESKTLRFLKKW